MQNQHSLLKDLVKRSSYAVPLVILIEVAAAIFANLTADHQIGGADCEAGGTQRSLVWLVVIIGAALTIYQFSLAVQAKNPLKVVLCSVLLLACVIVAGISWYAMACVQNF